MKEEKFYEIINKYNKRKELLKKYKEDYWKKQFEMVREGLYNGVFDIEDIENQTTECAVCGKYKEIDKYIVRFGAICNDCVLFCKL